MHHYSQARQFYISQTETEQYHIASAFTFELSKVQTVAIRSRMVGHLLNIDEDLANTVAAGLRLREMPEPSAAARPTRKDLKKSPALSIVMNGPESFEGRKVGALVTDGVDGELIEALRIALEAEGAQLKLVAPMIGGVEAADGTWIEADEKIDGGPSVVFDAVALLVSEAGAQLRPGRPTGSATCATCAASAAPTARCKRGCGGADQEGGSLWSPTIRAALIAGMSCCPALGVGPSARLRLSFYPLIPD